MKKALLAIAIAIVTGLANLAAAQDTLTKEDREPPHELTRQEKDDALRMAYQLNGGRMNGPMVDLTDPRTLETYAKMIATDPGEMPLIFPPPVKVKTAVVKPDPAPAVERADICRRHGMRKVVTGKSWRCRR